MKIAIHHHEGGFSDHWIAYCEKQNILYKLVDCYASTIVADLNDCDVLMWHWHHADPKAVLFARQLTLSLEASGKKVFPDSKSSWHFDDKVGQKYLFESLELPMVPSYVFYDEKSAMGWATQTTYPKVFKLRGGAGASNVKLARSLSEATRLIKRSFGRGFSQFNRTDYFLEQLRKCKKGEGSLLVLIKGAVRLIFPPKYNRLMARERGYVYFQDFIPQNDSDIRVIVIDGKAFAIKRMCREGDFRASGSGQILYAREEVDERCVTVAFEAASKLQSQCAAFDFVFDQSGMPLIVEVSYGFSPAPYDACPGWWDEDMTWNQGAFNPQGWMVELVRESV